MYQHLGDLIEFVVMFFVGVGLIFQWKKKKKEKLLWIGIALMAINFYLGGSALNAYLEARQGDKAKQEQKKIDREKLQSAVRNEIAGKVPLDKDSIYTFDSTIEVFVPKGYVINEHPQDEIRSLILFNSIDSGKFQVTIAKSPNKDNLSFLEYTDGMENYYKKSNKHWEFTTNNFLTCTFKDCKIREYKIFDNQVLITEGSMIYTKAANYFYMIVFGHNNLKQERAEQLTQQIFKSIKIKP